MMHDYIIGVGAILLLSTAWIGVQRAWRMSFADAGADPDAVCSSGALGHERRPGLRVVDHGAFGEGVAQHHHVGPGGALRGQVVGHEGRRPGRKRLGQ